MERVDIPEDMSADLESMLRGRLDEEFARDGASRWEFDAGEFRPYKGIAPDVQDFDSDGYKEEVLANSILLSSGETGDPSCAGK